MTTKSLLAISAAAMSFGVLTSHAESVDFEAKVLPILKERCFDCHSKEHVDEKTGKTKKPKGKFRMDSPEMMKKGGADGGDLTPGDPAKSTIYTSVTLPDSDDKAMPPKGDRLTKEQQDLIKQWIAEGANFGTWKGAAD
ncbi:MAG: Planctomycete cytochrome [Verrucomicrobiaceae bacterium]|nr:Planctomycete cytochrome [Verrucomicrobiaceae bacterium]